MNDSIGNADLFDPESEGVVLSENWSDLIVPNMKVDNISDRRSTIVFDPLESGMGITLGNSLRRVMLSFLQGAAVTNIKIKGVLHQFSKFEGVREDVTDIIQNIKGLSFYIKNTINKKEILKIFVNKSGFVTGRDIEIGNTFEVVDKDAVICFVNAECICDIQLQVEISRGYVAAIKKRDMHASFDNIIPIDSNHSPVIKVSFDVQNSRVGNVTDYDKLILDIETDGSITAEKALSLSAKIIQEQFKYFINFSDSVVQAVDDVDIVNDSEYNLSLFCRIDDLDLSVRSSNCLKVAGVSYIGDLLSYTESELMKMPNFGKKSLNEIRDALEQKGFSLGTKVSNWRPDNIVDYVDRYYKENK